MPRRELVNVRVSRRVLWLDGDAYPLQNIARARTAEIPPRRAEEAGKAFGIGIAMTLFGVIALWFLGIFPEWGPVVFLTWTVKVGGIIFYLFLILAMAEICTRKILYALVIETSGPPSTLIASESRAVVDDLVRKITDAIDDPQAEFQVTVENLQIGDRIQQIGNHNIGRAGR
ncbi:DUF6232 family protein [Streptomyces sp. NPDC006134]|uniref:DUF6232 family protein n=1 Tax=Streptomyces sp. NPDC006134 TaxID=3154467 RepID=UPI0033EA0430